MPAQRTEQVDGVPVVVVEAAGPSRCALIFRVGRADETLPTSGITHLVEHLAMHAVGRTRYDTNAFVDPLRTVFHATGTPEQLTSFLQTVTGALAELPLHRLDGERRIVQTEAAGRGRGPYDEMLTFRFGPRT